MSIDRKIRYKGQSLLDWYQLFIPIVNKYQKAASKQNLNAGEQKTLWKDHFVKQVNLAELVLMISVRSMHLTDAEVTSIAKFNEAEFKDTALLKLLAKLNSSFERYEPDKAVMTYLHQHSKTLNFELDFKNPKEQIMSASTAPKTRRLDLSPRPLIKGQNPMITNLLKIEDQVTHVTKGVLATLRVQPRQQPCP